METLKIDDRPHTYEAKMDVLIEELRKTETTQDKLDLVRKMYELTGSANDQLRSLYTSNLEALKYFRKNDDEKNLKKCEVVLKDFETNIERSWDVLTTLQSALDAYTPKENSKGDTE